MIWRTATTVVNARVVSNASGAGLHDSVRFSHTVLSLGTRPQRGDTVVDMAKINLLPR